MTFQFARNTLALCGLALFALTASAQLRYAGSDTVEPVVDAARIAFQRGNPGFKMTISSLGSSAGVRELCTQRAFLIGSSRQIKATEIHECESAGVSPLELPVGTDAVVLVVSTRNNFVKSLSMAEISRIYAPASTGTLTNWKSLRNGFPDVPLRAVGVGIKHGTFEFFHGAIGNGRFVRSDYKDTVHHEDTAKWVVNDVGAIGYVPYSVARDFGAQLRMVSVDFGKGPVEPSLQSISDGTYGALSRQTYLYLNMAGLAKADPLAELFVKELVAGLGKFVGFANMVPLSGAQYQDNAKRLATRK